MDDPLPGLEGSSLDLGVDGVTRGGGGGRSRGDRPLGRGHHYLQGRERALHDLGRWGPRPQCLGGDLDGRPATLTIGYGRLGGRTSPAEYLPEAGEDAHQPATGFGLLEPGPHLDEDPEHQRLDVLLLRGDRRP